ncbi:cadherin-19 [Thomomys bottae]
MKSYAGLTLLLGFPLLWTCLTAWESPRTQKVEEMGSYLRVKRGWVWSQFFVQEEMNMTLHVGQLRSDLDNGNNSFQYKLSGAGAGSIFIIDERTGDIYAKQKLDREERSLYTLRAQVIDTATGKAVEPESEFVIRVSDINDNEPKFLDEPYEALVPEMSPEGSFVIRVTASDADDPDTGNNARLLYSLLQGQAYFSIEPTTGVIRISSTMDRELQDEYVVIIQAKDMLGLPGSLSATTSVLIKLSDINDNKPIFKESLYRLSVSESAPTGTSIGKILAYDDDIGENAEMHYRIENDNSQTFDIITNDETQEGIVILKRQLDFEQQSHYGVRVRVGNPGVEAHLLPLHADASTTFLAIQVEDEDEPPVFRVPHYVFQILEENPGGALVGEVSATDPDHRKSPIRYSIDNSEIFFIDDGGTIITTEPLDREDVAWYNVSVTAMETENEQQISSIPVYIQVVNINDHAPEFSQYYETYMCENAGSGEIIQILSAVDRDDSLEDHHFYFNLSTEDTNNSSFTLVDNRDNTAVVLTDRSGFSLREDPVFYLPVLIADNGIPPLTSTNTLTVTLCDCPATGRAQDCAEKGLLFSLGFRAEVITAILLCTVVMFGVGLLLLALRRRRKQSLFAEKDEEFRENIFKYDDEGGGEEDTQAFDLAQLSGGGRTGRARKAGHAPRAQSWGLRPRSLRIPEGAGPGLQGGPDSAVLRKFIQEKLREADADPCAPPFDALQTFAFEGTGSPAGSLSSLGSALHEPDEDFEFLQEAGPRFKRLAVMFGSTVRPDS